MKNLILGCLILLPFFGLGQIQELTISFNNLTSNEGKIMILIQDENEKDVSKLVVYVANKSSKITVYLPSGRYGVIAFHDLNNNEELDTNFIGIPTEPYGFSNNARGLLSKPDYEETLVTLNKKVDITFELK